MTQRGKTLENYFNYIADIINANGGHAHKNNPLRSHSGQYIKHKGEPFDFEFFGKNHCYLFDAKESKSEKVYISSFLFGDNGKNYKQFANLFSIAKIRPFDDFYISGFAFWFNGLCKFSFPFFLSVWKLDQLINNHVPCFTWRDCSALDVDKLVNDCTGQAFKFLYCIEDFRK